MIKNNSLAAWKEVKEYIEYCCGYRNYCQAILYTDTITFLQPFIDQVESDIQEKDEILDIIKNKATYLIHVQIYKDYEDYKDSCWKNYPDHLTEEEFYKLKRYFEW